MDTLYSQHLINLLAQSIRFHNHSNLPLPFYALFQDDTLVIQTTDLEDLASLSKQPYILVTTKSLLEERLLKICKTIGVQEVFTSFSDPIHLALDQGIKITSIDLPVFEDVVPFIAWINSTNTPWITLSYGMSLDGKIATYTGDSKYITGPLARQVVHQLRHTHDAILVGSQTVLIDHPLLTTRLEAVVGHQPIKVILDSSASIDLKEPLLYQGKTIIVCKASAGKGKIKALTDIGLTVLQDPSLKIGIDLTWLMSTLWSLDIHSILVEGGGTIHFSFIEKGFFNRIYAQISPMLIGGKDAKTPVEGQGFDTLKNATHVAYLRHWTLGQDIIIKSGPKLKSQG
jgi:diaminohydroxyphosphoribosylaminopyrimidine deaminase/5-amino-6-(5-phosphoribosylamino)uracil reductase